LKSLVAAILFGALPLPLAAAIATPVQTEGGFVEGSGR